MKRTPAELTRILGFAFTDEALLCKALTHRSADGNQNNERLEFLGDSVLNFVITHELYLRYPNAAEGDLSRLRASLVNKESLARIAAAFELGEWLYLGSGELKSGGFRRKSILADALEAVFGAVLLDSGFEAAKAVILNVYQSLLIHHTDPETLKDPKTRLQEFLQARKHDLPIYELVDVQGKPHAQTFTIKCVIAGLKRESMGLGSSRRKAEQQAAEKALNELLK